MFPRTFLSARWVHLAMLNWAVDPALLRPHVPAGTVLDTFEGQTYVSLVGFLFLDTRILGLAIPGHRHFEEVNLRFYVRREAAGEVRRGVVFLREVAPLWAVCTVANWLYGENYATYPMRHRIEHPGGVLDDLAASSLALAQPAAVTYEWQSPSGWNRVSAEGRGDWAPSAPGSLEEYISEHYWGYACAGAEACNEYAVEHPRWNLRPAEGRYEGHPEEVYGRDWARVLNDPPASAFLCDGSAVEVLHGTRVRA